MCSKPSRRGALWSADGAGVGEDRKELESNSQPLAATLGPLLSSPFLTEPQVSCFPGTMTSTFIPHKAALDGTFVGQVPPPSTSHPTVGAWIPSPACPQQAATGLPSTSLIRCKWTTFWKLKCVYFFLLKIFFLIIVYFPNVEKLFSDHYLHAYYKTFIKDPITQKCL